MLELSRSQDRFRSVISRFRAAASAVSLGDTSLNHVEKIPPQARVGLDGQRRSSGFISGQNLRLDGGCYPALI
jgi:hypothetical protein